MISPELLGAVSLTRDWVIIFMGIAVALFFTVALLFTVVLGLLSRALLKKSLSVMDDNLRPLLDSAKASADNVKGTTSYVSQAAVTPIVKTYGVIAGVRRAASVLTGLTGASTDNAKNREDGPQGR
jgi:hypothetical protein